MTYVQLVYTADLAPMQCNERGHLYSGRDADSSRLAGREPRHLRVSGLDAVR